MDYDKEIETLENEIKKVEMAFNQYQGVLAWLKKKKKEEKEEKKEGK